VPRQSVLASFFEPFDRQTKIKPTDSGTWYSLAAPFVDSDANQGAWRFQMRMMMLVQCPVEPFNTLVKNGKAGAKMKKILDATKPEHVWFSEREGKRGGILIVDVDSPADVPRLAEPWFLTFNAEVEFRIAMTPEDLAHSDLAGLGKKWA
jgi:hypothetical protein